MASFRMERLLFVKKFTLYFRRLNFFVGVLLLFCCYSKCTARNRQYTAENCSSESVFWFFSTYCDPTKPYNKSLINLVCSVCTGKYCLRFLSHRPRSFVARSVRKTSGNTFPYRPRTRLISPYYYLKKI